jgi:predicted ester cyclase
MTEPTVESMRRLVLRFYERLWNEADDAAVDTTLSTDVRFRGSLGAETEGRDGWRGYRDEVRAGAADFRTEVVDLVCEPERAAARVRCSGTHTGALLGVEATGRTFEYEVAAFLRASGGLLSAIWVLGDLDALRGQLGVPAQS